MKRYIVTLLASFLLLACASAQEPKLIPLTGAEKFRAQEFGKRKKELADAKQLAAMRYQAECAQITADESKVAADEKAFVLQLRDSHHIDPKANYELNEFDATLKKL